MPGWAVILAILAAGFVPGGLIVRQFDRGRLTLPLAFAALALGLASLGWAALVLAELGLFSVTRLALVWLLLTGGLVALDVWRGQTDRRPPTADLLPNPLPHGRGWLALLHGARMCSPLLPRSPAPLRFFRGPK